MAAGDEAEATILHILEAANRSEGKLREDYRSAVVEDGTYQRLKGYGQAFLVVPEYSVRKGPQDIYPRQRLPGRSDGMGRERERRVESDAEELWVVLLGDLDTVERDGREPTEFLIP